GGDATTASLQRELVGNRGWLSERDFATCYAVSRITPGTNLLAFCTAVGWRMMGIRGALLALLLASIPGATLLVVLTGFYDAAPSHPIVLSAVHAALAATVGIMLSSAWILLRPTLRRRPALTVALVAASLFLSVYASFSPLEIIAVAAVAGLLVPQQPNA
ncbi:MAG: chromate transporter, partial [Betaproteobacteria bacterium]